MHACHTRTPDLYISVRTCTLYMPTRRMARFKTGRPIWAVSCESGIYLQALVPLTDVKHILTQYHRAFMNMFKCTCDCYTALQQRRTYQLHIILFQQGTLLWTKSSKAWYSLREGGHAFYQIIFSCLILFLGSSSACKLFEILFSLRNQCPKRASGKRHPVYFRLSSI